MPVSDDPVEEGFRAGPFGVYVVPIGPFDDGGDALQEMECRRPHRRATARDILRLCLWAMKEDGRVAPLVRQLKVDWLYEEGATFEVADFGWLCLMIVDHQRGMQ